MTVTATAPAGATVSSVTGKTTLSIIVAVSGVVLGVCGAVLLTRALQSMLNDVKPADPAVFAGTAFAVLLVSTLACYLPARAAGRVDPIVVLRDS